MTRSWAVKSCSPRWSGVTNEHTKMKDLQAHLIRRPSMLDFLKRGASIYIPIALNVSYTETLAPPFKTGQPLAFSTAVSSESALMME